MRGDLLPGHLQTSIEEIRSLQVCKKSQIEIFLAVSGSSPDYSDDKTDLFDVSGLFTNNLITYGDFAPKFAINHENDILPQKTIIKSQEEKIKKLVQERDFYKVKFREIKSEYDDIKNKHDQLHKNNNKNIKETYKTQKLNLKPISFKIVT